MKPFVGISTNRMEPRRCPVCHNTHDAATSAAVDSLDIPSPAPGDITVCGDCRTLLVFTETGYRLGGQAELDSIPEPLRQMMIMYMNAERPKGRA